MIAYNHYIKFIPELKNSKKVEGPYSDVVTIKKPPFIDLEKILSNEYKFLGSQGRELSYLTDREFGRTQNGQLWAYKVKDVITFYWSSGTLIINYIPHKYCTSNLLEYWCLQIVLPMFFTIEEIYSFLHAGAVEIEKKSILFSAESFGGKSTMTDFFMKQGHKMISDDKVATYEQDGVFYAVPSHSHHRPYRKMEDLGYIVENISTIPIPIQIIFVLERCTKNSDILITKMVGIEKFKALRLSSDFNLYGQRKIRFEYLMQLSKIIPVYKVLVPWDLSRIGDVYDAIVMHSKILK